MPAAAWAPGVLDRIATGLATFMGPVARLLVGQASSRAHSEEELCTLLAAEISSPGERDAFLRLARGAVRADSHVRREETGPQQGPEETGKAPHS